MSINLLSATLDAAKRYVDNLQYTIFLRCTLKRQWRQEGVRKQGLWHILGCCYPHDPHPTVLLVAVERRGIEN